MNQTQISELRELYRIFYSDALEVLKQTYFKHHYSVSKIALFPSADQTLNRYDENFSIKGETRLFIDADKLATYLRWDVQELDSAKKIYDFLVTNDLSVPFNHQSFERDKKAVPSVSHNYVAGFIGRICELSEYSLDFKDQAVDQAFSELISYLSAEHGKYSLFVNLYGATGDLEYLELNDCVIHRADYKISKLFCQMYSEGTLTGSHKYEMLENDFYLEIQRTIKKADWQLVNDDYDIIKRVFDRLILSNTGNIEMGKIIRFSNSWPLLTTSALNAGETTLNVYNKNNKFRFELNKSNQTELLLNHAKLNGIDFSNVDGRIHSSMRRIRKAKATFNIEDKIIEIVLSIEYLINTAPYEVTLQLCLKLMKLLNIQEDAEQSYKNLKKFFKLRGDVIHGNKPVKDTRENIELVKQVEKFALDAIVRFLELRQTHTYKAINEALDKSLYDSRPIDKILKKI